MSSALAGLSQYADSESDSDDTPDHQTDAKTAGSSINDSTEQVSHRTELPAAAAPNRLKRKLPPLEADALQQDKVGASAGSSSPAHSASDTKNVVRGEWLCYCFVEVLVDLSLNKCIRECHTHLQEQLGSGYTLLDLRQDNMSEGGEESISEMKRERLHISLTRPFTVRSYERDEYVKVAAAEVKRLKANMGSFPFTFSRIAHLANDDASRHFMVLEVGSGRDKLHQLSTALSTELRRAFRAKSYYEEARFHASTACAVNSTPKTDSDAEDTLAARFSNIVTEIEAKHGPQLRKCQQVWASRIGIQVANRVTYVDL